MTINKIQALQNIRTVIDHRYMIGNRNKENDQVVEDSYETLFNLVEKTNVDVLISDRLMNKIKSNDLIQYNIDDTINGYRVHISITKEEKK